MSLTLVRRGRAETAAYTGVLAMQADERQYGLDNGPCLDLIGALNVYSRRSEAFDEDDIRAGQTFAAYAAVAVANADSFASTAEMAENLRHAMASRATIEQAKGILMARGGVTPEQAFEMLVRASQRENRKLRQVATELVARVQQRQPPAPSQARSDLLAGR